MRSKLIKISLITFILLGLVIPNGPLSWVESQASAGDSEAIQEPFPEPLPEAFSLPGRVEGTGTYFEIKDSEYLNITLQSTEEIKVVLESIPRMISMDINSSTDATFTVLTVSGLEPNKTYYQYQDSYKNEIVFNSGENGNYSWIQDLFQPRHVWIQEIKGTTFIDKDTVLDHDITGSVEITTDNVTLDCDGHNISSSSGGSGYGIYLKNKQNVRIENCTVNNFYIGIYLVESSNNTLKNNTSINNLCGISLWDFSNDNIVIGNNASKNWRGVWPSGIHLYQSSNNTVTENIANNNGIGIAIHYHSNYNIVSNNTANNNYHWEGIEIVWSTGNIIMENMIANNNQGLQLHYYSHKNIIKNNIISNNLWGIIVDEGSDNNTIYHNNFINNEQRQAWVCNPLNFFDQGYPSGGNYWSDYAGVDEKSGPDQNQLGSDGIGDTPYAFACGYPDSFPCGQDKYPFMRENGWEVLPRIAYIPVRYIGEPEPTHTIAELKQRAELVQEYYKQQSYGVEDLTYKFVFNEWKSLGKSLTDYPEGSNWWEKWEAIREEAINLSGIDINDYDSVIVIQPACMRSFANNIGGKKIITTDKEPFGVLAHELGHTIFKFYDYYEEPGYEWSQGNIHYWGLMGAATLMNPTAPIMSYNKERADWLEYTTIPSEEYGEYPINLLKDLIYGDDVYRYNTISGSTEYYIFEGRYPKDDIGEDYYVPTCSIALPGHICLSGGYCGTHYKYELSEDEGILLYKVTREVNPYTGEPKIFTIPHPIRFWPDAVNKVTLTPNKTYIDEEAGIKFTALKEDTQLQVEISEFIPFWKKIISLSDISWEIPSLPIVPEPIPSEEYFDIDLHVYAYDGRKVGMDYTSLNYENQIEGVNSSGNIPGGGPEWISIPKDEKVYYIVDATPAKEWAEELNLPVENLIANWQIIYYDENGKRKESDKIIIDVSLDEPTVLAIRANIDIDPDVLDLKNKGKWITAYIELPEGYDVSQIDINNVMLNYIVSAENDPKYGFVKSLDSRIGDYDNDKILDCMIKFDRAMVQELLQNAEGVVELIITGEVIYNKVPILFQGIDTIKIMPK